MTPPVRLGAAQHEVPSSAIRGDEGSKNFVEFIRSYFRMGGYHVQFNIVDSKMLRDAQDKPQNYRDLMVRVAGFSAYWNELGKPIQDEVIARTEYESSKRCISVAPGVFGR